MCKFVADISAYVYSPGFVIGVLSPVNTPRPPFASDTICAVPDSHITVIV